MVQAAFPVEAGFTSSVLDFIEKELDLNEELIRPAKKPSVLEGFSSRLRLAFYLAIGEAIVAPSRAL